MQTQTPDKTDTAAPVLMSDADLAEHYAQEINRTARARTLMACQMALHPWGSAEHDAYSRATAALATDIHTLRCWRDEHTRAAERLAARAMGARPG